MRRNQFRQKLIAAPEIENSSIRQCRKMKTTMIVVTMAYLKLINIEKTASNYMSALSLDEENLNSGRSSPFLHSRVKIIFEFDQIKKNS